MSRKYLIIFAIAGLAASCSQANPLLPKVSPSRTGLHMNSSSTSQSANAALGTPTTISFANWTTYTDSAYGFSLKIPPGYVFASSTPYFDMGVSTILVVYDPKNPPIGDRADMDIDLSRLAGHNQLDPASLLQQYDGISPADATVAPSTFGGCPATHVTGENKAGGYPVEEQEFVARNGLEYKIEYDPDYPMLAKITSTFMFFGC